MLSVVALVATGLLFADEPAENELQTGIALTKSGQFQQAIPHFLAARGRIAEDFALEFNLALCYVGTRQFPQAIQILTQIGGGGRHAADVDNLLAQAFVGDHQQEAAMKALQRAAGASPANEKLYLLVSEACFDEGLYELGIRVLEVGLHNLPDAPLLLFERGLLRSQLEQPDLADRDFQLVRKLSPDSGIAYIAAAQQALLAGNVQETIRAAREGIRNGHPHYLLLTMLGEALLRAGATPATPAEFGEAQAALERAVAERPGYSSAHVSLGRIYLAQQRTGEAITQLERGRQLDPRNRAVYAALATAWRQAGKPDKAQEALAALAELNRQEAARIGSADGGHSGYSGGRPGEDAAPR
ncbi:MAG: tetratricopeptide repeat protein [Bryobacteraceae bacterium]